MIEVMIKTHSGVLRFKKELDDDVDCAIYSNSIGVVEFKLAVVFKQHELKDVVFEATGKPDEKCQGCCPHTPTCYELSQKSGATFVCDGSF